MQGRIPEFQAFEGTQGNKGKLGNWLDIFLFTDLLFNALNLCRINHLNSFPRSSEKNVIALSISINFIPKGLVVPRYIHVEGSWRQAHALYFQLLFSFFYNISTLFIFRINLHKWILATSVKIKIADINSGKRYLYLWSWKCRLFLPYHQDWSHQVVLLHSIARPSGFCLVWFG